MTAPPALTPCPQLPDGTELSIKEDRYRAAEMLFDTVRGPGGQHWVHASCPAWQPATARRALLPYTGCPVWLGGVRRGCSPVTAHQ